MRDDAVVGNNIFYFPNQVVLHFWWVTNEKGNLLYRFYDCAFDCGIVRFAGSFSGRFW